MMDKIEDGQLYTATIVLTSVGSDERVTLEKVQFEPDISDEAIDANEVPWSYKLASFLMVKLREEAAEAIEVDVELEELLRDTSTVH